MLRSWTLSLLLVTCLLWQESLGNGPLEEEEEEGQSYRGVPDLEVREEEGAFFGWILNRNNV